MAASAAGSPPSHPLPAAAASAWPLVGRSEELERIARARAAAEGPGVVLTGPAGVGKSRLAREAVAAATAEGAMAVWIQATRSAASVPLGACAALVGADAVSDEPLQMMRASAESLRRQAAGRPVVLGVDDAERLDQASAALILHLAMTGAVFLVVTVRSSEPCPEAIVALWKDAGAERLEVEPLSAAETGELVEAVLGGPLEQEAHGWAYDSTLGNVLYLYELITAAIAQEAFAKEAGIWRLVGRPRPTSSLLGLVEERLERLTENERRAVELLALGEPLRAEELGSLVDVEAVDAIEELGIAVARGGELSLAHPLYGDVVEATLPSLRAAAGQRELARVVGARAEHTPEEALRVARWLLDAGETPPTDLLVEASAAAIRAGDPEFAERLGRLALDGEREVEAALLVARACTARRRHAEAEEILAPLEGRFDDQEQAIAYLHQRTAGLLWGLRRREEAQALLARARGWWDDPAWLQRLAPLRPRLAVGAVDFRAAAADSAKVLAEPDLDPAARRRAGIVHVINLFYGGRVREAYAVVQDLEPPVPLRDESDQSALALAFVIAAESGWGDEHHEARMRVVLTEAVAAGDQTAAGIAAVCLGALCLLHGRYEDAARWLGEATVHLEREDPFGALKAAHALLAGVAYYTGDVEGAAAAMERCRAAIPHGLLDTDRAYVVRGEAWLALAEGDPPRAQARLLEGAEELRHVPLFALQLYHQAMRAGAPPRRLTEPLTQLREVCDGRLPLARVDDVLARAARDAPALLACADEFEEIAALPEASECAAAAAAVFADEGREDSARRAAARSAALHARCQGGTPPDIPGFGPAQTGLTPRETQIVELARRGAGNAEIAAQLQLSVRTVESHMYRAMAKLGVSDRREL